MWANFQRIIELFTQKIVTKLSKIWLWYPGSEIRDPEKTYSIPDPGSRVQKGTGSRIRIRNTVSASYFAIDTAYRYLDRLSKCNSNVIPVPFDMQFLLLFTKNLHIYVKIDDDSGSERQLSSVKINSDLEPSLVVQTNVN
jgi:hypothetical protein